MKCGYARVSTDDQNVTGSPNILYAEKIKELKPRPLTLELPPEKEDSLKAQAQARGLTVEQWLLQLAEQSGPVPLDMKNSRIRGKKSSRNGSTASRIRRRLR